jgi:methyl-accepting chemotaxis protein
VSESTLSDAQQTEQASHRMTVLVQELSSIIGRFKDSKAV